MRERLVILTGSAHDDAVLVEVAEHLGLSPLCCDSAEQACSEMGREASALVVTEEACGHGAISALAACLARQPPWSDLPVIALTSRKVSGVPSERQALFDRLGHITLLQRPLRWETLVAAVVAAVRSRRRQYVLAEHMARLAASAEELEAQVRQRTRSLQGALAKLQETQAHLVESQRLEAIGQLTGGVAHDFNNLLQVISSSATLVSRARQKPELQTKALDTIRQATTRGSKLTQQLLAFASRQPLTAQTIHLPQLLHTFGEFLQRAVRQEIALTTRTAPDVAPVHADVSQLEMSIMNLVVNAQDAIDGPGRISVNVFNDEAPAASLGLPGEAPLDRAARFVCIEVEDTGTGMSDKVMSHAFEPFFTTKAPAKGTGLGLSQVFGFARQSGGAAAVRRTGPDGTTMAIWLPEAQAPAALPPSPQPAMAAQGGAAASGPLHILIVEDDVAVAEAVDAMVRHLGHRTHIARSADEALRSRPERFDLVFSDVLMPGSMDGVELALRLRAAHPDLPVLLTSGYAGAPERVSAAGFALLRKPYTEQEWQAAVTELLATVRSAA